MEKCAECRLIGFGTVLIIATLIISILWSESKQKWRKRYLYKRQKNEYNMNRSIELNTDMSLTVLISPIRRHFHII